MLLLSSLLDRFIFLHLHIVNVVVCCHAQTTLNEFFIFDVFNRNGSVRNSEFLFEHLTSFSEGLHRLGASQVAGKSDFIARNAPDV